MKDDIQGSGEEASKPEVPMVATDLASLDSATVCHADLSVEIGPEFFQNVYEMRSPPTQISISKPIHQSEDSVGTFMPQESEVSMSQPDIVSSESLLLLDDQICIFPNCIRPRYKDKDRTHSFCGRNHADRYQVECQSK